MIKRLPMGGRFYLTLPNHHTMKTKNLTCKELLEINGGSSTSSASYGGGASVGADSLLTLSSESHDGDRSQKSELSVGKGISLDLLGLFKNQRD
jgi:hypothetical protein